MRKLFLSIYLFGLLLFFLSFFGKTTATEMTNSEGAAVKTWESGAIRHFHLALDPLLRGLEFMNAVNVPERYGAGQNGDGYESHLSQTVKRFVFSLPVSIGWFNVLISILLFWWIWTHKLTGSKLRYFIKAGSVLMLIAVPILAVDFYSDATTYNPHFHLGTGAYLIVSAYLLIGIALLKLLDAKETGDADTKAENFNAENLN